jgi:pimeloyl-ACP methyl ester carboxylesterase
MRGRLHRALLVCFPAVMLAQPAAVTYRSPVDNSDQPYALYVPKSLDRARRYPLVIGLHEEDSNHAVCLRHVFGVIGRAGESGLQSLTTFPAFPNIDYIVACPFARGTMGYQGIAEQDVYDVIADVKRRYPVDEDRVYLTGASMGGGGALWMALTRPDMWAAVAPVCAAAIPDSEELAGNALNFPVRLFHGELDPAVPPESSREWQRRLLEAGVRAEYTEFPAVRHNAWDAAYRGASIFDWFTNFKRDRDPARVHFSTRSLRYNSAWWTRIDALAPGALATIDAVRSAAEIRVTTSNIDGFTLTISPPFRAALRTIVIDGAAVRSRPAASLSFVRSGAKWTLSASPAAPAFAGPVIEAVNGRHIYVYGAGDEQSRRNAAAAAAWSTARARLNLVLPVKSDREITEEDLASANLVLFGNAGTNRIIARIAAQLPVALNAGAADYGLLEIAPIGHHYALISSGLPWWTGAADANRGGYRFAPEQYRLLSTFGDYILFKGSLANVLVEGRFDRNGKLPADAAARLEAAGTVALR